MDDVRLWIVGNSLCPQYLDWKTRKSIIFSSGRTVRTRARPRVPVRVRTALPVHLQSAFAFDESFVRHFQSNFVRLSRRCANHDSTNRFRISGRVSRPTSRGGGCPLRGTETRERETFFGVFSLCPTLFSSLSQFVTEYRCLNVKSGDKTPRLATPPLNHPRIFKKKSVERASRPRGPTPKYAPAYIDRP